MRVLKAAPGERGVDDHAAKHVGARETYRKNGFMTPPPTGETYAIRTYSGLGTSKLRLRGGGESLKLKGLWTGWKYIQTPF